MTFPESCSMRQVRIQAGRGDGRPLHEEELAGGAVRVALHDHRAVADVRQQQRRDVGVVLDQVALRDAELRPEQLVEVREMHLSGVHRQRDGSGWRKRERHQVVLRAKGANGATGAVLRVLRCGAKGCYGRGAKGATGAVLRGANGAGANL